MYQVFFIVPPLVTVLFNIFFTVKEERTRGHGVTLAKKQCRQDIRTFLIFTKNSKRMDPDYQLIV